MAEYKEVINQRKRMCRIIDDCKNCPLCSLNNKHDFTCSGFMSNFPEEAEEIIMKWAEEHLIKTNAE